MPASVDNLLATRVDTFEKLDLVIALHGAQRPMSVDLLARMLAIPRDVVQDATQDLQRAALVEVTPAGRVRLHANDALRELVTTYRKERVAVVSRLAEVSIARIRSMATRVFSEAIGMRQRTRRG